MPCTWRCVTECTTTIPTRFQTVANPSPMGSAIDGYYFYAPNPLLDEAICFVGASHALRMHLAAKSMGMHRTRHIRGLFARELHSLANASRNCSRTIVHTGQWDLGWPEQTITPIHTFAQHVRHAIESFKRLSLTKLIIVSNNYAPLGIPALACPPTEWRRPDLDFTDKYNHVFQQEALAHGIKYIDNNKAVMGMAWDSGSDWCHPETDVAVAIVKNSLR